MKNRNLWLTLGAIILIVLVVLIGIRVFKKPASEENVIKIGAILPLTGPLAYLGEEEKNVLLMAEEEINSKEGYPKVQILFEDSKSNAKDGVSAYHKLRLENIRYLITSLTIVSEAVNPLAKQDNVLQIALSVHPDIAKRNENLLRPYYGLEDEMKLMADYLASIGAKKIAALYINTPEDNIAVNEYFKNYLKINNLEYVWGETYEFTDQSVKNQLLKLKKLTPDYIMTIDFGYMYPIILKEAQMMGIREKILGGLGMMTAPSMSVELLRGITFVSPSFVVSPTPKYLEFTKLYEKKYGKKVTFDGVYTYDAFYILYENIKNGKYDYKDFLNKTYSGISGTIYIDSTGTGKVEIAIAKFDDNGNIIRIK